MMEGVEAVEGEKIPREKAACSLEDEEVTVHAVASCVCDSSRMLTGTQFPECSKDIF